MKLRLLTVSVALLFLPDCGPFYDDSGAPDPASWWPWVCSDGGPAPESGCPTGEDHPDGGADSSTSSSPPKGGW
jgi:hypothetical protein